MRYAHNEQAAQETSALIHVNGGRAFTIAAELGAPSSSPSGPSD